MSTAARQTSTSPSAPGSSPQPRPATPALRHPALTTLPAARLVAAREIAVKLRDRVFLLSTAFTLVIIAASIIVPAVFFDGGPETYRVTTVGREAPVALSAADAASEDLTVTAGPVRDVAAAERAVADGDADAALVPGSGDALQLVGDDSTPADLVAALTSTLSAERAAATLADLGASADQVRAVTAAPVTARLLDTSGDSTRANAVALVFALLFYLTVFVFGFQIAQSVTEEKASRVVELLVAAVPVRALLVGKIAGATVLAVAQIVLFLAVGLLVLAATGQGSFLSGIIGASGWFVVFFLLGFTMLSTLWAAAGAMAARIEDLQSTTGPLQLVVIPTFFLGAYVTTPGTFLTVLSYVPFTAPLSMPRRLLIGDAAWWEALVSAGIIAATTAALVVLASRLYRGSLLRTGSKTSIRAAWASGAQA